MEDLELGGGCWTAIIITAVVVVLLTCVIPLNLIAGKGEHKGYITAVDTYENFMSRITVVYFKTDLQSSQEDSYCINNASIDIIGKAKKALSEKKNVILKYEDVWFAGWMNCSGDVIRDVVGE
jgi:hypothetical protein